MTAWRLVVPLCGLLTGSLAAAVAMAGCDDDESSTASTGSGGQGAGGECSGDDRVVEVGCEALDAGDGCPWFGADGGPRYPEGCAVRYFGHPDDLTPNGMCTPSAPMGGLQCGFPSWEDPCTCYCECECQQMATGYAFVCPI
jgi:hypothetical protein